MTNKLLNKFKSSSRRVRITWLSFKYFRNSTLIPLLDEFQELQQRLANVAGHALTVALLMCLQLPAVAAANLTVHASYMWFFKSINYF